jgi:hypothetical protein
MDGPYGLRPPLSLQQASKSIRKQRLVGVSTARRRCGGFLYSAIPSFSRVAENEKASGLLTKRFRSFSFLLSITYTENERISNIERRQTLQTAKSKSTTVWPWTCGGLLRHSRGRCAPPWRLLDAVALRARASCTRCAATRPSTLGAEADGFASTSSTIRARNALRSAAFRDSIRGKPNRLNGWVLLNVM